MQILTRGTVGWLVALLLLMAPRATANTIGATGTASNVPGQLEYQQGVNALRSGNVAAAEAAFQKSLRAQPKQASSYIGLANVAAIRQDDAAARRYFERAIEMTPDAPAVHLAYGQYLSKQGASDAAEAAFVRAIAANEHSAQTYYAVAEARAGALGNYEGAIAAYQKVLEFNPTHFEATLGLGRSLAGLKRSALAESAFRRAATLKPESPMPEFAVAQLLLQQGKQTEALAAFQRAAEVDPRFVPAYVGRADVYTMQKKYDLARAEADIALRIVPEHPDALVKRGVTYQMQDKFEQADRDYRRALERQPNQAIAYNNLAWMWSENGGDLDQCLAWAERAVALLPKVSPLRDTLGWVHYHRGDYDKALAELRQAADAPGADSGTRYRLGLVQEKLGDKSAARANVQAAVDSGNEFDGLEDAKRWLARSR